MLCSCRADVGDRRTVDELVEQTILHFGRLDIAVTNAVYSDRDVFHQADIEGFHRTVQVTMWGALLHACEPPLDK